MLLLGLISIWLFTDPYLKPGDVINGETVFSTDCVSLDRNENFPAVSKTVTFALLTDLHVVPGSSSDSLLNLLVNEINKSDLDFTVVTGDISNSGSDSELLAVKKALDKLRHPCYILPGNHETNWSESAGLSINRFWGNDRFLFNYGDYMFVGFNTGPFMKMGDGHVKKEDLIWLERQLYDKKVKGHVLISFSHYPLSEGLDNWLEVTDILNSYDCRIDFCGHGHRMNLLNFNGITGIMGRAMLSGNSPVPGYSIIKLSNDSVLVYNKVLSEHPVKPVIRLNYLKPDTLSTISVSQKPDYSVNKIYSNFKIAGEWSDSSSIFSGPCMVNDSVLVYGNSVGIVKAINLQSGRNIWQTQIAAPVYSTPVYSDGIVILGTVDGNIIGLDARNGSRRWKVITGKPVLAEGLVENGFVYIGGGDREFYKIDIGTGKIIWQFSGLNGLIQGKAAVSDSEVIFGAWDQHLYCLDKKTGTLKWKWNNGKPQKLYSPGNIFPVCTGNRVFIVAPDRYMTVIDLTSGKEIWRTNKHQVRESMGVSPDGSLVYAKLMIDTVVAISSSKDYPSTVWAVNAGFGYEHNPCPLLAAGNLVIAATRNGLLVAIDPISTAIIWKYKAGNSSINKVVADNNQTLWVTLTEGKIIGIQTIYNQHY